MLAFLMETESEGFVTVNFVRINSGLTSNLPVAPIWANDRVNYFY